MVAYGMLVLSVVTGLIWETRNELERESVVAFYGIDDFRFTTSTSIGDTVRVEWEVNDREWTPDLPGTGTIRYRVGVVKDDETTALSCEMTSLVEWRVADRHVLVPVVNPAMTVWRGTSRTFVWHRIDRSASPRGQSDAESGVDDGDVATPDSAIGYTIWDAVTLSSGDSTDAFQQSPSTKITTRRFVTAVMGAMDSETASNENSSPAGSWYSQSRWQSKCHSPRTICRFTDPSTTAHMTLIFVTLIL